MLTFMNREGVLKNQRVIRDPLAKVMFIYRKYSIIRANILVRETLQLGTLNKRM